MRTLYVTAGAALAIAGAFGQGSDARVAFEAASVKAADAGAPTQDFGCEGCVGTANPGEWRCRNMPLSSLVVQAYGVRTGQYAAPVWMRSSRFDVIAKVPAGATLEQLHQMQQRLLEERFKLKYHREPREVAVYELTVAKNGLKMKATGEGEPDAARLTPAEIVKLPLDKDGYPIPPAGQHDMVAMLGRFIWHPVHISMTELVSQLSIRLGRPVVDATGLEGFYEFTLRWFNPRMAPLPQSRGNNEPAAETPSGPTFEEAVQGQFGLRLESKKGSADFFVVDTAERSPVGN